MPAVSASRSKRPSSSVYNSSHNQGNYTNQILDVHINALEKNPAQGFYIYCQLDAKNHCKPWFFGSCHKILV